MSSCARSTAPSNTARLRPASTCDLLDVDRLEAVAREQPALVDADRGRGRGLPEREIEVLEREPDLDVALRAQPSLEELADRARRPSAAGTGRRRSPSRSRSAAFALSGLSPNVADSSTSPGSLPPRISALVLSMKPCSLTRSIPPWTSASVSRSGSSPSRSGTSKSRFLRSRPTRGDATNGPVSVIVPWRSSPPIGRLDARADRRPEVLARRAGGSTSRRTGGPTSC